MQQQINHNKNTNNMTQQKQNLVTQLIAKLICTMLLLPALLLPSLAQADFRKALTAYQNRDGKTMLAEVQDAVDKKNDDGLVLFLGVFGQHPKTFFQMLTSQQSKQIFKNLEKFCENTSLQSQYLLAIIPREVNETSSNNKIQENINEIERLEIVANKGYAPAALSLYGNYMQQYSYIQQQQNMPNKTIEYITHAKKWLHKAAKLGDTQAAFVLGMKLLNIQDDFYGCYSYDSNKCIPKDEAKGWYWMQQAAKTADAHNIVMGDFAYYLGGLYQKGVAGNKPNYQQAYLWYQQINHAETYSNPSVWPKLEELKKQGSLRLLNPSLDKAWEDALSWQEAMKKQEVINIFQEKPTKLPLLLQTKAHKSKSPRPVFSMSSTRWFKYNLNYSGLLIDINQNGEAYLTTSKIAMSGMKNKELWKKIKPTDIKKFITEIKTINLDSPYQRFSCEAGCIESLENVVEINIGNNSSVFVLKDTVLESQRKLNNPQLIQILKVVEKYFSLSKLICNAESDQGKSSCYEVYQDVLNVNRKGEEL